MAQQKKQVIDDSKKLPTWSSPCGRGPGRGNNKKNQQVCGDDTSGKQSGGQRIGQGEQRGGHGGCGGCGGAKGCKVEFTIDAPTDQTSVPQSPGMTTRRQEKLLDESDSPTSLPTTSGEGNKKPRTQLQQG